jgi:xylulokinase
VRVSGGGAKSALWRQILADVLGAELVMVNTTEGSAYGAAILAGVGYGAWPDVDTACSNLIRIVEQVSPKASGVLRSHARSVQTALPGAQAFVQRTGFNTTLIRR